MLIESVKSTLLYAGLSPEEYGDLVLDIRDENAQNLAIYAPCISALFLLLTIASIVSSTFASSNTLVYAAVFLCSLSIAVILKYRPQSAIVTSGAVDYVFCVLLYIYSGMVTLLHPEYPAVASIVILVIIPLLFTKRPLHLVFMTLVAVALFCVMVLLAKPQAVAIIDIWDALSFGLVASAVSTVIVRVRVLNIAQAKKIAILGTHDLLTGLKNRNCFEVESDEVAKSAQMTLGCVFLDANGLHELNNSLGHAKGDELLKCIANALKHEYGENTYRIGGDEFAALCVDMPEALIRSKMETVCETIALEGYSTSFGIVCVPVPASASEVINSAESKALLQKAEYYRRSENDRRAR